MAQALELNDVVRIIDPAVIREREDEGETIHTGKVVWLTTQRVHVSINRMVEVLRYNQVEKVK